MIKIENATDLMQKRKLQENMGNISTKDLLYIINKIIIPNFPIIRYELKAANDIFGEIVKALKVNIVHKSVENVKL